MWLLSTGVCHPSTFSQAPICLQGTLWGCYSPCLNDWRTWGKAAWSSFSLWSKVPKLVWAEVPRTDCIWWGRNQEPQSRQDHKENVMGSETTYNPSPWLLQVSSHPAGTKDMIRGWGCLSDEWYWWVSDVVWLGVCVCVCVCVYVWVSTSLELQLPRTKDRLLLPSPPPVPTGNGALPSPSTQTALPRALNPAAPPTYPLACSGNSSF